MTEKSTNPSHSLFDFGPLAREYDRWYETSTGQAHDRGQKADVARLLRRPRSGQRLLEVGCGTGHWSRFFASLGYQVHGVDLSPEMIGVARSAVAGCVFEVADACALPFEDASFDVVAAMATLEFVSDSAMAVREMARCAKPGGCLLIGTLNKLSPFNRQRLAEHKRPYASGRLFAPGELGKLVMPFGKVRMIASPINAVEETPLAAPAFDWRPVSRRDDLRGPFIVAEVRK